MLRGGGDFFDSGAKGSSSGFFSPVVGFARVLAIVLVTLGVLTYRQLGYWHDGETLWRYALSVTDRNYLAHDNLAMVLDGEGKTDEAITEFRASEALHEFPPDQILKIGLYEQRSGRPQGAIEQYQKVSMSSAPSRLRVAAWDQTGFAYVQMADYDRAKQSYESAERLDPNDPSALVATGLLAARAGDLDRAAVLMRRAMQLQPNDVGYLLLADTLRRAGSLPEAQAAEDLARKISSNFDEAEQAAAQTRLAFGYKVR